MPLAVVAIGGNALSRAGEEGTIGEQFQNARATATHLVELIHDGWELVLTHGNGPQVGNMLWRVELARQQVHPIDLGICDANSQGQIGYMLQQVLSNEFHRSQIDRHAITLVTQVEVNPDDPAFDNPQKPVGPFFSEADAQARMAEYGWCMREDAGRGWRRVVPSPKPQRIVELSAIRSMARGRYVPIAVGGGGIPVVSHADGTLHGVEAVIDKDLTASLLARQLRADALVICTAVDRIALDFRSPEPTWLDTIHTGELAEHMRAGQFPPGSMGPKVEALLEYMSDPAGSPLRRAVVTDHHNLVAALRGKAGTTVWLDP